MSEPEASALPAASRWAAWRSRLERLRKPLVVFAAVGTVLGGLAGYLNVYRAVKAPAVAAAPAAGFVAPVSLLVLPLANNTGDPGKAHVADGLTGALVADLGRIEGAAIVPAAMAFTMQRENLTLQELGTRARARFVLQGGVQASGDTLRVTAQLYDTVGAATPWSEVFEGNLQRLFELQDAVTTRVRVAIAPTMTLRAAEDASRRAESRDAADLLLRYEALRIQPQSLARLREMERLARAALAADPENLRAMVSLARALYLMEGNFSAEMGDVQLVKRARDEAQSLARKVYQRNPADSYVFGILATGAMIQQDYPAALEWARRMTARGPSTHAGVIFLDLGLMDEALRQFDGELALPEFRPRVDVRLNMAMVALYQDRPDDALRWARDVLTIDPDRAVAYCLMAAAFGLKNDEAKARASTAECLKRRPGFKSGIAKERSDGQLWPMMGAAQRDAMAARLVAAEKLSGIPQE